MSFAQYCIVQSEKLTEYGEQSRVDNKVVFSAVADFSSLPWPMSVPFNQEDIVHDKMLYVFGVLEKGV